MSTMSKVLGGCGWGRQVWSMEDIGAQLCAAMIESWNGSNGGCGWDNICACAIVTTTFI